MNRKFLLILIFLMTAKTSFAVEIVYPKKNPSTINSASTFFIGSTNPSDTLKINDIEVKVGENGAFAQTIPLTVGKNSFIIKTTSKDQNQNNLEFIIERPAPSTKAYNAPTLVEYPPMADFYVKADGTPIRTTAVDSGINRMAHLPKGMRLVINGEKNAFYRVYLNSKTYGWIDKSSVEQIKQEKIEFENNIVKLKRAKCRMTRDLYIYEFEFEKQIPFTIREENNPTTGLTCEAFYVYGSLDNTLSLHIPIEKIVGYDGYWHEDKFILKIRKTPPIDCEKPLKNIKIIVDAGHGGNEYGAIGCCGAKEKDINLAISKYLEIELNKRDAKVLMSRNEDIDVSLSDRVKFAHEKDATILLSIHANALPDSADPIKNKGTSVYYYHRQAKPLAESVLNSMTTQLGTQNDKVRQGSLALVRPTASVSILIEVAYMINPEDYALLTDKDFQEKCAKAIADGIEEYLKK